MKKFLQSNGLTLSIVLTLVACAVALMLRLFTEKDLPFQIFAAIIGVIITAIITQVLLKGQSDSEEVKERNMTIFEKKQEVYHNFLEKLHEIVQDRVITINQKGADGKIDKSIDELKDLIFQLSMLQLHTSKETIEAVMENLTGMIQTLNKFNARKESEKQKHLAEFYSSFSNSLFVIVSILKQDLYNTKDCQPIEKETMKKLLEQCNLYVETKELDKKEIQKLFWDGLQERFIAKGYPVKKKDYRVDIEQFYARERNRHRWYGLNVPVIMEDGRKLQFRVEIENGYYYGFSRPGNKDSVVEEKFLEVMSNLGFYSNDNWFGWKYPSTENNLDFWKLDSAGFKKMNDARFRDEYLDEIADEMEHYIKEVLKNYKD